ncbi:glycine betaine ABC transporter substrate-binding protein [Streptomyces spiralis]
MIAFVLALAPTGTITQTALRNGTVDAADIFSTDPAVSRYGFVSLRDPRNLFAAQNVMPLFKRDVCSSRTSVQAGRPDPAHGRCLQRSFGQADHGRPRRTRRTGPGAPTRKPLATHAFPPTVRPESRSASGQPAAGGIAVPSTLEQDRRQPSAPAGERCRAGRPFRPVPCPTPKPFGTCISHRREACSCQLTSRTPTFSTPQATTYARRAPGSAPEAPSRR